MRIYRSVSTYIWNDDKFPFVSDDCQLVWFHIFTNPLNSPLGLFRASLSGLAEDKNRNGKWPLVRCQKAFAEALREGFMKYDPKALLIAFPKYFSQENHCNHPQSPNVVMSWGERFRDLPNSPLKDECYQALKALLEGKGEAFKKAFHEAFAKTSLNTDSSFLTPESKEKKNASAGQDSALPINGVATWESYAEAYRNRYQVDPVRNQTINSQLKQVTVRLGYTETPMVAAFYLTHNKPLYVSARHPTNLLLRDCEGLRTEWATGNKATTSEGKNLEFRDNVVGQADRVLANIAKREAANG